MNSDEYFLRRAIALAFQARENTCDPFAAVLVNDGEIVYEGYDHCVEMSDPTYHAELSVISNYCRSERLFSLHGYTLYCSAEPCPMCIGAIHWSRISRVVFSVSQQMLQAWSGGTLKPSMAQIAEFGFLRAEFVGPLLPEEGIKVFDGLPSIPKIERHAHRFGNR
jgi:tRNA(Arg) A34 adenosine deaminase TadA